MLSLYLVPGEALPDIGSSLRIDGDEAHHIARVARHRIGEEILVSDGEGSRARATIVQIDRDSVQVRIEEKSHSNPATIRFRVIQALTKSDRAHECVDLLVAAGVDEIVPWSAERSIGKWDSASSYEKWLGWIRSAVKQTRRDRIPKLEPVQTDPSFAPSQDELILAFDENADVRLDGKWATSQLEGLASLRTISLVIGPEGGLSNREIERLESSGAYVVRLGTPILRSAHAGAIALSAVQAALSIWH